VTIRARWLDAQYLEPSDVAAWRDLAACAAEPNPFLEAPFLLPAVRHLARGRLRLLVLQDAAGWAGLMPVQATVRWRRLPAPVRAGWRHPYNFLGTPLLAAGREDGAAQAMLAALRPGLGLLALDLLGAGGPAAVALEAAAAEHDLRPVVWERHERAALVRRPENDYVASMLKSRRRRELRRLRRQLGEALGAEIVTTDRAGDHAAVERFLELEASGWKGRAGTALADAGAGDFFREICERFAAEGRLQLLSLEADGRSVAMKCNLLSGGGVFCLKIAHDEEHARFSPGVQLELDNVDVFHARPELRWMDSCADPDNEMINRLWPDRRSLETRLLARGGFVGLAARNEAEMAAAFRRRMKERKGA
jgi:CelD/BcsL family acetyltransferase involved in cellulose biosynthesis